jgi:hypothetical protein
MTAPQSSLTMGIIFSFVARASRRAASTILSTFCLCFRRVLKATSTRLSMRHAWRRAPHAGQNFRCTRPSG